MRASLVVLLASVACCVLVASCGSGDDGDPIAQIMSKPRYTSAKSQWSMVVMDANTGQVLDALDPDMLVLTASVRKLYSVATALNVIGADHRFVTPVYRTGTVDGSGMLTGNLILQASGDLTFGGRQKPDGSVDFTDFDHNDARGFGGAILTPEDPLTALNDLAQQVRASGITAVAGDVIIDDRLFDAFRVPNGNVLISPIVINENVIDVTLTPGASVGAAGVLDWRPRTSAMTMQGTSVTTAANSTSDIMVSGDALNEAPLSCLAAPGCKGTLSSKESLDAPATIPLGFVSPLVGNGLYVSILRVEDPPSFARTAFIDALARAGVSVSAPAVQPNQTAALPPSQDYSGATQVASYTSMSYSEFAKLVLKVSLNTGANLSLMYQGLAQGVRTVGDALVTERRYLTGTLGLDGAGFNFPTNGSGTPDSQATARTTATLLAAMSRLPVYPVYHDALSILGIDGSLAAVGKNVAGKEHIFVKSGATIDSNGQMVAMNMAGYIDAKSGRRLAYALFVNNAGPLTALSDTLDVFDDEAMILGILYARY
ncbi:D-alanyl-D-alanine carboxypeptidase/D-alanyl-D-alanine-endopeptidase [Paraburkholderia terrae]|uniref:D-alanyl-D-alanine carboxypeptidase/D-alanyl-D-alanine-endopeptidase n=1 Tax=Paraburkholderia terrae TaxID=311230 RepID=A0ABM7U254_9BURK|nr:D-alanyl-D-alanine carboxypeptidase [Paraburkholderia terrae]BCZ85322.1 D-alanyl-D-alanine carboxypeptidase/D-alanyl-D-alanine-endopeptidase [Paraburkholderia terrae]BDC45625.1 D-alanyl-D-alanine carboxypeptidase/D-alanyl-D-alanine-endopeptidase [Paraburkholderia terrae]